MRIIGKRPLPERLKDDLDVLAGVRAWYGVAGPASWASAEEVLADFPNAVAAAPGRVRFEITEDYGITVAFDFGLAVAWIAEADG